MIFARLLILAAAAPAKDGGGKGNLFMSPLFLIVIMFALIYFMFIRPQQKKQRAHREMVNRLKAGDKVVTTGGIHGIIQAVKAGTVLLKVDDKTKLEVSQGSISNLRGDTDTEETKEKDRREPAK